MTDLMKFALPAVIALLVLVLLGIASRFVFYQGKER